MDNIIGRVQNIGKKNKKQPDVTTNLLTVPVWKYLSKYLTHILKPHKFEFFNTISLIINHGQRGRLSAQNW